MGRKIGYPRVVVRHVKTQGERKRTRGECTRDVGKDKVLKLKIRDKSTTASRD